MTADLFPRLVQRHAVPGDQVGEHAGGGAGHARVAVDQHLHIVRIDVHLFTGLLTHFLYLTG